jgi:hypothetical protein
MRWWVVVVLVDWDSCVEGDGFEYGLIRFVGGGWVMVMVGGGSFAGVKEQPAAPFWRVR